MYDRTIAVNSEKKLLYHQFIRGGPFDTWGAMVFLCDQTFFLTCSLNVQIFLDLTKSKQFFLSRPTQNTKQFIFSTFV